MSIIPHIGSILVVELQGSPAILSDLCLANGLARPEDQETDDRDVSGGSVPEE
jgi:hypothetical protein